jgi:hypothetical protein
MLAYKFLLPGARGPFSGFAWPTSRAGAPGPWVAAEGGPALCRTAVHGCLAEHLPWWIQEELWRAEFDEPATVAGHKLMAGRARLVRRVAAWDRRAAGDFAAACAARARDRAVETLDRAGARAAADELRRCEEPEELRDVAAALRPPEAARISVAMAGDAAVRALMRHAATAAYIAAHAANHVGGEQAMAAERAWQGDWLRRRLDLRDEDPHGGRR